MLFFSATRICIQVHRYIRELCEFVSWRTVWVRKRNEHTQRLSTTLSSSEKKTQKNYVNRFTFFFSLGTGCCCCYYSLFTVVTLGCFIYFFCFFSFLLFWYIVLITVVIYLDMILVTRNFFFARCGLSQVYILSSLFRYTPLLLLLLLLYGFSLLIRSLPMALFTFFYFSYFSISNWKISVLCVLPLVRFFFLRKCHQTLISRNHNFSDILWLSIKSNVLNSIYFLFRKKNNGTRMIQSNCFFLLISWKISFFSFVKQ